MKNLRKNEKEVTIKPEDITGVWWEGGTLHDKTIAEWKQAEFGNGLATCADMVVSLKKQMDTTITYSNPDELLPYCLKLMTCLTEATKDKKHADHLKISELVVISAHQLGWIKGKKDNSE